MGTILPTDYTWLESYITNDLLFYEDVLNWDEVNSLTLLEFISPYSLFMSFFLNIEFYINSLVKLSWFDFLLKENLITDKHPRELYFFLLTDLLFQFYYKFSFITYMFYSNYQDTLILLLNYSPELILAFENYLLKSWESYIFNINISSSWDLFSDNNNLLWSEFFLNFFYFWIFILFLILFFNIIHLVKFGLENVNLFSRVIFYFTSLSREMRIQLESTLHLLFLVGLYLLMALSSFDDASEEKIEIINLFFFSYFMILILFLVYKHSIHYFAFLESSDIRGRSISFIIKQFFRDIMGSIGLFLRFFILLFRLNVYDNLDDFFDSYYIFVGDFDEDEYNIELFFSSSLFLLFETDSHDDSSFLLEDDIDLFPDFFLFYFISWSKLFLFLFFILEEIFRIALALYISYIIIFEIHASNNSYNESQFSFN